MWESELEDGGNVLSDTADEPMVAADGADYPHVLTDNSGGQDAEKGG